jgi:hypothetical protein
MENAMSRIFGLLLLLIITVLLVPPIRQRARPYMQPALDPVYEWSAKNRVKTLVELMREEEMLGRHVPTAREFSAFVENRDSQRDASLDPWGNPYYLRMLRKGYYVGSSGRDQIPGTPDDIVSKTITRRDAETSRRRR